MKNLNYLLEDAKMILDELSIPYGEIRDLQVGKSSSWWGRCRYNANYNNYTITINEMLLQDEVLWETAMDTMIHELLHAYKGRMCHTGEWKRLAGVINNAYPEFHIQRCKENAEVGVPIAKKVRFAITCKRCGRISYYTKMTRIVKLISRAPENSGCICHRCKGTKFTFETL